MAYHVGWNADQYCIAVVESWVYQNHCEHLEYGCWHRSVDLARLAESSEAPWHRSFDVWPHWASLHQCKCRDHGQTMLEWLGCCHRLWRHLAASYAGHIVSRRREVYVNGRTVQCTVLILLFCVKLYQKASVVRRIRRSRISETCLTGKLTISDSLQHISVSSFMAVGKGAYPKHVLSLLHIHWWLSCCHDEFITEQFKAQQLCQLIESGVNYTCNCITLFVCH